MSLNHNAADLEKIVSDMRTLTKSFEQLLQLLPQADHTAKPSIKETSNIPNWCKVGQWVIDCKENEIGIITRIFESDSPIWVAIASRKSRDANCWNIPVYNLKPIRFRPYEYEEAKGLLGKTLEYCDKRPEFHTNAEDPSVDHASLIYRISRKNSYGEIFINSKSFYELQGSNATINGVPIGVPEVDEEAMKKGEQ